MNGLDILLIIPLIYGLYSGFKKGFIIELISSLLLVFGFIKGISLFYTLLPIIARKFPALVTCLPIALAIAMLFIGGLLVYLLTKLIKGVLVITILGIFDNLLGSIFGLCKIAFFISLLLYVWGCLGFASLPSAYTDNSFLFPLLEPIVPKILQSMTSIEDLYRLKQWYKLKVASI